MVTYSQDLLGDTKLQKFVTDFYAASDVAPPGSGRDPYLKFFVEPATVVMATNVNKGVEGITAMRQAMWKTVTHRLHVPLNVASINATEKLVNGTVEYTLVGGKNVKVEWAAYIKLAESDELKMEFYQVYLDPTAASKQ
ncbi:hypothetical protein PICST_74821 [Scheffersomyces stipitis CBS 6054]|uniref:SnoaL-like domain-containing protein n=1 Tax=Scheffersomyces stipitis (strain ATCC 58785 / CBS 6054 / NBRC 10063 / NRRL Y-11545) TaxID=322104 RepID=A3GGH8_PICST|nr:predicted protein [Scheffersomyces stipitis CBS 6054]EAZ63934.1 hypothetical protein PICST_74821 [Scheffersomyces stipitis CBS 6054]KAG2735458.1 hypothetical protein G9P44_001672 [Scheffersomyces stipitis]